MPEITKFPPIPSTASSVQRNAVQCAKGTVPLLSQDSLLSVMQSAWGVLVGLYLDKEEVTIASGAVPTTESHESPPIFAISLVIRCDITARHLRETAAKEMTAAMRRPAGDITGSVYNSILLAVADVGSVEAMSERWPPCAALLLFSHESGLLSTAIHFDQEILPCYQAQRMLRQLCHLASQIATESASLGSIDLIPAADRAELIAWHSDAGACDTSIIQMISAHFASRPDSQALDAHDGSMTYAELDRYSAGVAAHLIGLGLARGDYVPLLFDKSIWCIVAMLAVLRAGAAFVPLSSEYPRDRIAFICTQVSARVALASEPLAPTIDTIVGMVVVISRDFGMQVCEDHNVILPPQDARTVAYIMHTSGSTGLPKGAMLEHGSVVVSARNIISKTSMKATTRVLHFSNYIFGAAMAEIWSALIVGGCLCIPSEEQRLSSLDKFMVDHGVTWACMTPSLVRMHSPATMPGLKTLAVGGETVTCDILQRWASFVKLYTVYGSAEQSHIISMEGPLDENANGASIGRMFSGSNAWVVMPKNVDSLVPLGCVGELVTEGPQIARGYLQDPARTSTSFPDSFPWRNRFPSSRSGSSRFYRTGDIVRYTTGGHLEFVSRREGYVKINGQRVELGEIEYHIRAAAPEAYQVCVELCIPAGVSAENAVLVAFIAQGDDSGSADRDLYRIIWARLSSALPLFMVPRYYYPLRTMPKTISGKTARAGLRNLVASLSPEHLVELAAGRIGLRHVKSPAERYMQKIWAQILHIPETAILADDTFFNLGGDSRKAVSLYRMLQLDGHEISVRQILAEPTLSAMAQKCIIIVTPGAPGSRE